MARGKERSNGKFLTFKLTLLSWSWLQRQGLGLGLQHQLQAFVELIFPNKAFQNIQPKMCCRGLLYNPFER